MAATKSSAVWNFFGEGEGSGICKACGKHVKWTVGKTSNFKAHLKVHHPAEHQQLLRLEMERKEEAFVKQKHGSSRLCRLHFSERRRTTTKIWGSIVWMPCLSASSPWRLYRSVCSGAWLSSPSLANSTRATSFQLVKLCHRHLSRKSTRRSRLPSQKISPDRWHVHRSQRTGGQHRTKSRSRDSQCTTLTRLSISLPFAVVGKTPTAFSKHRCSSERSTGRAHNIGGEWAPVLESRRRNYEKAKFACSEQSWQSHFCNAELISAT